MLLLFITLGCSSAREFQDSSQAPPPGTLWSNSFGHTDVYSVTDTLPQPVAGYGVVMHFLKTELSQTPCNNRDRLLIMAIIDTGGMVSDVHIKDPTGEACESAASGAIKQFEFKPGIQDGKAVKTVMSFPVSFKGFQK